MTHQTNRATNKIGLKKMTTKQIQTDVNKWRAAEKRKAWDAHKERVEAARADLRVDLERVLAEIDAEADAAIEEGIKREA